MIGLRIILRLQTLALAVFGAIECPPIEPAATKAGPRLGREPKATTGAEPGAAMLLEVTVQERTVVYRRIR